MLEYFLLLLPACQLILQVYWFVFDTVFKPASFSLNLAHLRIKTNLDLFHLFLNQDFDVLSRQTLLNMSSYLLTIFLNKFTIFCEEGFLEIDSHFESFRHLIIDFDDLFKDWGSPYVIQDISLHFLAKAVSDLIKLGNELKVFIEKWSQDVFHNSYSVYRQVLFTVILKR